MFSWICKPIESPLLLLLALGTPFVLEVAGGVRRVVNDASSVCCWSLLVLLLVFVVVLIQRMLSEVYSVIRVVRIFTYDSLLAFVVII